MRNIWKWIVAVLVVSLSFLVGGWLVLQSLKPVSAPAPVAPASPSSLSSPSLQPPTVPPVSPIETGPDGAIDTSDWKTYRNEEYGFEVKYPGEWEIEKGGTTFPGVVLVAKDRAINGKELAEISIYIPTLREWRESNGWKANDQTVGWAEIFGKEKSLFEKSLVLNKMMVSFEEEGVCSSSSTFCFSPCSGDFFTRDKWYSIRYASFNGEIPSDISKEICSEMMSSFKAF